MTRIRRRRRADPDSPRAGAQGCYVVVEEARVRCERICEDPGNIRRRGWLRAIHRELGYAGYVLSTQIPADTRGRLLTISRRRSTDVRTGPLSALESAIEQARSLFEATLEAGGADDHVHLAHVHILSAVQLLCWPPPLTDGVVANRDGLP